MATKEIKQVASFTGIQVTGVTISPLGRLFANFPRWHKNLPFSVVEVNLYGEYQLYPTETWNTWHGHPTENTFTCGQCAAI